MYLRVQRSIGVLLACRGCQIDLPIMLSSSTAHQTQRLTVQVLKLHPVPDGAKVIAKVQRAGWLHPGQYSLPAEIAWQELPRLPPRVHVGGRCERTSAAQDAQAQCAYLLGGAGSCVWPPLCEAAADVCMRARPAPCSCAGHIQWAAAALVKPICRLPRCQADLVSG